MESTPENVENESDERYYFKIAITRKLHYHQRLQINSRLQRVTKHIDKDVVRRFGNTAMITEV